MNTLLMAAFPAALWLLVLAALRRARLNAWRFLWGSAGVFIGLLVFVMPAVSQPLARVVSALAGVPGTGFDAFTAYFKYGVLFIDAPDGSLTLSVDFECSGIIEIMAFVSLLIFFDVYTALEKVLVALSGVAAIIFFNAMRIALICLPVHFFGTGCYYLMHAIVGRLFFYAFSIVLYFYVFTKPQIIKMKVGSFSYEHHRADP